MSLNFGLGIGLGVQAQDASVAAIVAAMSPAPNAARYARINTLVLALKAGGVWAKLDLLYIEAAHDTQAAKLNWITPASYTAAIVGGVTFTTDAGFTGDGTTGYLTTGYIPNTHGVTFLLDDASMGAWSNTNALNTNVIMGARTTSSSNQLLLIIQNTGNVATARINTATTGATPASTNSSGFFILQRTASNALELFRNDVSLGTATTVSTSRPTVALVLLALNTGGTISSWNNYQTAVHFAGGSFTSGQRTAFYNALNAYMTGLAGD